MNRALAYACAVAAFAASAQAADLGLDSMKDPLPDTLTWHGVTFYGTIDVGYAYQTNGRPNGDIVSVLEYSPFNATRNFTGQHISTLTSSALEQSKIGVKIEEDIGLGWLAIGKLDTAFNPLTGELDDGCRSMQENIGVAVSQQTSNGDSSRCGQAFNGVAYGGVSNASFGTLTIGRQNSLQLDAIGTYDPMSLSYAFSLLGYSGANAGVGSTQAARWDDSVKYLYAYGPFHAAAMYSNGGQDTGTLGEDYGFNVGAKYQGLSIDAVYTKENAAINLKNIDTFNTPPLIANISNNEAWSIMGKYTFEFGGGFKDDGPSDKLTLFGGYTHTSQTDPSGILQNGIYTAQGGYTVKADVTAFQTAKVFDFYWTGAKYALASGWSFTGAYYHINQNSFEADGATCASTNKGPAGASQCAGSYDQGSVLVDYEFNKHFDVYAGVTYGRVADGLAANFQGTPNPKGVGATAGTNTSVDTTDVVTGFRFRF
jgi:predicted porin